MPIRVNPDLRNKNDQVPKPLTLIILTTTIIITWGGKPTQPKK